MPCFPFRRQQFLLESFPFDDHDLVINVRSRTSEGKEHKRPVRAITAAAAAASALPLQ